MFKLRREMQAIESYAITQEDEHLNDWMNELSQHYFKIGEMIPSWRKKLDVKALNKLRSSIDDKRYENIIPNLYSLRKSCQSCHDEYQEITALLYRAPDFSSLKVNTQSATSFTYKAHMQELSKLMNHIKISLSDGMPDKAQASLTELSFGMEQLGGSCKNCHKSGYKNYPNDEIKQSLKDLNTSLQSGNKSQQGRNLGHLAVTACATCHGIHKLTFATKQLISSDNNIIELLKH